MPRGPQFSSVQLFHGPTPRSPLHRLAIRLSRSRSNTSTEYSLSAGATQLRPPGQHMSHHVIDHTRSTLRTPIWHMHMWSALSLRLASYGRKPRRQYIARRAVLAVSRPLPSVGWRVCVLIAVCIPVGLFEPRTPGSLGIVLGPRRAANTMAHGEGRVANVNVVSCHLQNRSAFSFSRRRSMSSRLTPGPTRSVTVCRVFHVPAPCEGFSFW